MSAFERITYIDRRLRESGSITVKQVANHFEVAERQVKRDIEYLRWRLDAPIVYQASSRSYIYCKSFEKLRFADERMLLFYIMVRSIAAAPAYIPFISRETLENLEGSIGQGYRTVSEAIRYDVAVSEPVNLEHFSVLCHAIMQGVQVELSYTKADGETSTRIIEAQRLQNYMGKWYLVAYYPEKSELRTFLLNRIEAVRLLDFKVEWFAEKPSDKDHELDTYMESGFGVFHGDVIGKVTIRFDASLTSVIGKQTWHEQQKDVIKEGAVERTVPVTSYLEILGRVLSFGANARPTSPPEFVGLWQGQIKKMAASIK